MALMRLLFMMSGRRPCWRADARRGRWCGECDGTVTPQGRDETVDVMMVRCFSHGYDVMC